LVFGIFVDVPLIVGTFALMFVYRKRIAGRLRQIPAPRLLIFLLLGIPLIIFEEDINCMPAWCGKVLIPPTLPFLLLELLILGAIALRLHGARVSRLLLGYCVFGVAWEATVGGLKGVPPVDFIIVPYVALSYAYVSMLPLEFLVGDRRPPGKEAVQVTPSG
jgi:hypothetical protein